MNINKTTACIKKYYLAIIYTFSGIALIIYTFALIAFPLLVNDVMFHPWPEQYLFQHPVTLLNVNDHETVASLFLYNPTAKYTILYSHGNAVNLNTIYPLLRDIQQHGYSVMSYDYPGYGESTGRPNEESTYAAIKTVYSDLVNHYHLSPKQIILWGHSIGTGPTTELATTHPFAGVIIESGFTSIYRVITHIPILPFDKFDNLAKVPLIHSPILIVHGKLDNVIPFYQGEALFQNANKPKFHLWVKNAAHDDCINRDPAEFWQLLNTLLINPYLPVNHAL